jgi:hypothetical protein
MAAGVARWADHMSFLEFWHMNTYRRLQVIASLTAAFALYQFQCLGAEQDEAVKKTGKSLESAANVQQAAAFLGVGVVDLDPATASHLPGVVSGDQGILVLEVSEGSPAAKSGIKSYDILMTYDDQKLFTPEQLSKLIRGDKPGREVTLGLIRAGKSETTKVTLGERALAVTALRPQVSAQDKPSLSNQPRLPGARQSEQSGPAGSRPNWSNFDSMTLKKLDKDRFHASIRHTDPQGKLQTHEFEGTRDEIRQKIEADTDLTPAERAHLLRSLDVRGPGSPVLILPDGSILDF